MENNTQQGSGANSEFGDDADFDEIMEGLKGGIDTPEASFLRTLASSIPFGDVLEVGSFRGKSAVALSWGTRERTAEAEPGFVHCVEPHAPFVGVYGGVFGPQDRRVFFETMVATGCYENVGLLNCSSEVISPGWTRPLGMVFIDGDHTEEGVRRDLGCWERHLVGGGLLVFDDSISPRCGVKVVVEELLASGRYRLRQRVGKVTSLVKIPSPIAEVQEGKGVLVVCEDYLLSGGLNRFKNLARYLSRRCGRVAFCVFGEVQEIAEVTEDFDLVTVAEAFAEEWTATLIPGSGFSNNFIGNLEIFGQSRFGRRIQFVLSDQSKRNAFLRVNAAFRPHAVIFNSSQWGEGTFTDFSGDSFHVIPGAVQESSLSPDPTTRLAPKKSGEWCIGGQSRKNPSVFLRALRLLPEEFRLRLFGGEGVFREQGQDLIDEGRLELVGVLHGDELRSYYHGVDFVLVPELCAGWANVAAEAMAEGVPVICSAAGTVDFARNRETALLVDPSDAEQIAGAIRELAEDPELRVRLAAAGLEESERHGWEGYAQRIEEVILRPPTSEYICRPDWGLFGKWPLAVRLSGLSKLIADCREKTVLDLGAAEGFVGRAALEAGATVVHGFELDASRVEGANHLCEGAGEACYRQLNLNELPESYQRFREEGFLGSYDTVLYLGIHHHLREDSREEVLRFAASLARNTMVIRTPVNVFQACGLEEVLADCGWSIDTTASGDSGAGSGNLWIFSRSA